LKKYIAATKSYQGFIQEANRKSGGASQVNHCKARDGYLAQSKDSITCPRIKIIETLSFQ
jgi:hypothetical protein